MKHTSKIERLELQITYLETDLKAVTADKNKLSDAKYKAEQEYEEASRVIAELQRRLKSLIIWQKLENKKKVLTQRKINQKSGKKYGK